MEEIVKKRVIAVVAVIVLLVGASVASIIYMKSGKNNGRKTAYIYRDNELLRTVSLDDVKNPYTFRIELGMESIMIFLSRMERLRLLMQAVRISCV